MPTQKRNNSSKIINLPTDFKGVSGQQLSRDEVRSRKKKRLKRKRAIIKALLSLALLFVVCLVGFVLAITVFFKVDTIKAKGSAAYPQKIIVENCGVQVGDSLLLTSEAEVSKTLISALPFVGAVTIERELPSTLVINIKDTKTAAAISNKGQFILINDEGKVLNSKADILVEGVPVVSGVEIESAKDGEIISFKSKENGDILIGVLKAVTRAGIDGLTEIDVSDASQIFMRYDNRIKILVGSSVNLETKILRAAAAIERENEINQYETGVLDLRTEPKVYFKTGDDETTTEPVTQEKSNKKEDATKNLNKTSENAAQQQ